MLEAKLSAFETLVARRNSKVEHSLLNRLNGHKQKYDEIFKSFN